MLIKFFIILSFLVFIISIVHATFSIVFKHEFKFINKSLEFIKKNKSIAPIMILIFSSLTFLILYSLASTQTFTNFYRKLTINGTEIGGVGDFFNGLVAPAISIISIIYLWKAFVQQFKANQMLYRFEIERSFKTDIDWLRNNMAEINNLENDIANLDNIVMMEYLQKSNNVRKCIYLINVIDKLNTELSRKKSEELDFKEVEKDISLILESLYLPSLKNIYRVLGNYLKTSLESNEEKIIDMQSLEVQFLISFSQLYENSKLHPDKLFEISYSTIKKLYL